MHLLTAFQYATGKVALKLHPRTLEYVTDRAQHFDELQSLKASAPTEYFRGAFNQLENYKRLEKLQHVLQRVKRLRVNSIVYKCRWAGARTPFAEFLRAPAKRQGHYAVLVLDRHTPERYA